MSVKQPLFEAAQDLIAPSGMAFNNTSENNTEIQDATHHYHDVTFSSVTVKIIHTIFFLVEAARSSSRLSDYGF